MSYELVPLGDLGEIVSGSTPDTTNMAYWDGNIPWITPADLTAHEGIYFTGNLRKITEAGYDSCSTTMLPTGSILFSSRAPIGHCAVTAFPLCTNQGFKSIVPNERLDPVYGFFALKCLTPQIEALGRGATFTEVNKEIFESVRIPLAPLPDQRRIADLLSRADRLRRLRRYGDSLGQSVLHSVFLEMFGDPVRNERKWERASIADLGDVQTGNTPSRAEPGNFGDFIEWIKSDNILDDQLYVLRSRESLSRTGLKKGRSADAGAVLMTCITGSLSHIGDAAIADRQVSFNQQINAISPNTDVDTLFLRGMLGLAKPYVQYNATAGMKHIITKSKLEELVLIKPPLPLQEKFAATLRQVEGLRRRARESARQGEELFQALLVQSFGSAKYPAT